MNKGKVISVNISKEKGTVKQPVSQIILTSYGIEADAHAGPWNRQVSLLASESIETFSKTLGRQILPGEFAENITTRDIQLDRLAWLDRITIGDVVLEVTQIGKSCHGEGCAIFREVGKCVMPKEGIFTRVIVPGQVSPGDPVAIFPKTFTCEVITMSDRASAGVYEDLSGPEVEKKCRDFFDSINRSAVIHRQVIPDDEILLDERIQNLLKESPDLIITTGGTGIGPRDITPGALKKHLRIEIPGIMEMIRWKFGQQKPNAFLSRSIAGVAGKSTLVFTLPGSLRAVDEYLSEIFPVLEHCFRMVHGLDGH